MPIESKPFRQTFGAEHLYLFDGMWQREDQFENHNQLETIVLGYVNYFGSALQQHGLSPRKLRIPPFPNFSFQITLTKESILLILGQSASTSIRFAYYKNYSQITPTPTLESVIAECENNYGWESCLGASFTAAILTDQAQRNTELEKEADILAKQFGAQATQKEVSNNNPKNQSLEYEEYKRELAGVQPYAYDVALSFAGEDRSHAVALAEVLFRRRVKVFYDKYEKSTLWGKDLYVHLSDLYQNKARYCVMFFSQHYIAKAWTKHELKAAQARALNENQEYILPIRLDSTEIPGILKTTAYLNWHEETPESVAEAILEKLGKVSHIPLINEKTIMDWLVDEAQMSNGKVSVDVGDIPGLKHSMRMTKENEDWEAWYGLWFEQEFTGRMGFEPTEESVEYALEKYWGIAE